MHIIFQCINGMPYFFIQHFFFFVFHLESLLSFSKPPSASIP